MTAINYKELQERAAEIDCYQFLCRHNPLTRPHTQYDRLTMIDQLPPDKTEHLSKQNKIKLLSKKYYQ